MTKVKKGLALVIGNADYKYQPKVLSCKKDGLDMKNMLEKLNFDVIYGVDSTRADMY